MKIKRFFASDIRQALRQVRETLGPDAVILSNKSTDGGVELVAAMDYDESAFSLPREKAGEPVSPLKSDARFQQSEPITPTTLNGVSGTKIPPVRVEWSQEPALIEMRQEMKALRRLMENQLSELTWKDMGDRHPQRRELFRKLMGLDLSPDICNRLVQQVADIEVPDQAWRKALHGLASELPVAGESLIDEGGVVALIGPTGVGKTTTVAKLAARYVLRHGHRSLALVSTDSYRIGAQEQLNTYAKILDVTVRSASTPEELRAALDVLSNKRLVLIDTAGMSQRDVRLSEQLSFLTSGARPVKSFLTLSATTQQSALEQAIKAFGETPVGGCILTKVDEAASLGGALSAAIRSRLPLAYFTDGQKVPEDIHLARANTLVNRCLTLGRERGTEFNESYLALALGGVGTNAHG
ncbi:MAG: flagellar biosynthesis protein FlhF [Gammaproteobacteria bacterium]|nr:flagellar biosynthesis protein FlhF [Gammaproteobacteria bacterium]